MVKTLFIFALFFLHNLHIPFTLLYFKLQVCCFKTDAYKMVWLIYSPPHYLLCCCPPVPPFLEKRVKENRNYVTAPLLQAYSTFETFNMACSFVLNLKNNYLQIHRPNCCFILTLTIKINIIYFFHYQYSASSSSSPYSIPF